jgi:hypothetical protein
MFAATLCASYNPSTPTRGFIVVKKAKPYDTEGTLLREVRHMLGTSKKSYLEIYKDTGLQPNWLDLVRRGKVANPSVNRIQYLHEYLKGSALAVN